MRRISPADLLRIASGLSLLLLVATEEKVCPWLVSEPLESDSAPQPTEPTGDPAEPPELPPLLAGNTLPDALAPRWGVETVARNSTAPIIGSGAAVPSGDDGAPREPAPIAAATVPAPRRTPLGTAEQTCTAFDDAGPPAALLSSITPTGPPRS
jgi:hypothetical protein